jgi:hypothetical protein
LSSTLIWCSLGFLFYHVIDLSEGTWWYRETELACRAAVVLATVSRAWQVAVYRQAEDCIAVSDEVPF